MTLRHFLAVLVGLCSLAAVATPSAAQSVVSVTQYNYDEHNRPICTAVRMNPAVFAAIGSTDACTLGTQSGVNGPDRITRNSYDAAGQLIQVDQAYGTSVQRAYARYTYTANGQKATEKDANGNLTTLEYDGFDRLSKLRYPSITVGSGTSSTTDFDFFDYDPNGNRTHWRRRDGQVIKECFDKLNRLTVHYLHSQSGCTATGGAKDVYTSYDLTGKILSKRFASFSGSGVTYAYDGLGRVTSTTDMNSRTVAYQYNVAGARTRLQFPDGINIDYALDNASRVKSLGWNASSGAYSRDYNSLGQLTAETKGGGSVSYAYDGVGRLTSFTNNLSGTASDIAWTFEYNPAGQVMVSDASSTLYNYEELTGITEPAQSHDGLNRVSTLVGATGACPSGGYDARGNLICDGTGRSYAFDVENRLLTGNIAGNGLTLTYDPEGRLASYSWNGGAVSFLYDGVNLIGEYNSSNQMLRRYVHGPGTDNPVVWYEGAGNSTRRYFYTNQQGSVITTADASGTRGDIYTYGAYGEPKDQSGFTYWPSIGTGATSVSRFGYTGQMFLADARLYYYKARIYDPQMGRFLQTDPVGSKDDLNLYAYVGGDPINKTDPTGMVDIFVGGGGDSVFGVMRAYSQQWQQAHPDRAVLYYGRMDAANIRDTIDAFSGQEPVNVISHSWGTGEAAKAIMESSGHVDNFITLDPVSRLQGMDGGKPSNVDNWLNVEAVPSKPNFSDTVANTGNLWQPSSSLPTKGADVNVTIDTNHNDVGSMMRNSDAERTVDNSYKNFEPSYCTSVVNQSNCGS